MLNILNYKKAYHSNLILSIPNLTLESGIFFLKGANGAGKTTLLQSIAGLIAFEGEIIFNGKQNLKSNPVSYRGVVNYGVAEPLYPEFLTGMDMIGLFLVGKKGSQEQVDYLLTAMDFDSFINKEIREYSSGMLKKLSLLLAFLGKSQLILLDEPFITLDNESINNLLQWIKCYREKWNSNFIISSHQTVPIDEDFQIQKLKIEKGTLQFELS